MGSVVQTVAATETTSSSTIVSPAISTTTGNILQFLIGIRSNTVTVSSIVDPAGNTYAKQLGNQNTNASFEVWTTTAASPTGFSSGTVTVHVSGGIITAIRIWEISGANNTAPIDKSMSANAGGSGTAISSGATAALTAANELCFGASVSNYGASSHTFSAQTFTQGVPSTSWVNSTTGDNSSGAGSSGLSLHSGDLVITNTATQTYSETVSATSGWSAGVWVLNPPASSVKSNMFMVM